MASNTKIDAAKAQFMKLQREQDGKKAMAEYEATGIATRAKTEKLRALRLARDAEIAAAASVPAKTEKKARAKAPTLSAERPAGQPQALVVRF